MNYSKYKKRINDLHINEKRYVQDGVKTDLIVRNDGYVYIRDTYTKTIHYIKITIKPNGYLRVEKVVNGIRINKPLHRIVAETFIPNDDPVNKTQINHIDGNKCNNNVFNLEWVTPKENMDHALLTGLRSTPSIYNDDGSQKYHYINSKIHVDDNTIRSIFYMLSTTDIPIYNIANEFNVDINLIRDFIYDDKYNDMREKYDLSNRKLSDNTCYSNEDIEKVCQMLTNKDMTIEEISKDLNIDILTIYDICIGAKYNDVSYKYDLSSRFDIHSKTSYNTIHNICKELSTTDKSIEDIAHSNNVNISVVQNIIYGINWVDISKYYDLSGRRNQITNQIDSNVANMICKLLQDTNKRMTDIAKEVGVSRSVVRSIYEGRSWTHISKKYDFTYRKENQDDRYIIDKDKAIQICELLQNTNLKYQDIADKLGVNHWIVKSIRCGNAWTNISKQYDFSHRQQQVNTDIDVVEKICELLQNTDKSYQEIASICNVRKNVVISIKNKFTYSKISNNYDFSHRDTRQVINDRQAFEICELLEKGYSRKKISIELGINESIIRSIKERKKFTDVSRFFNF